MSCNLMKASLLPLSTHLQTANDERGLWGDQCHGHRCMHTHTNICKHGVRSLYFQHHIGGSSAGWSRERTAHCQFGRLQPSEQQERSQVLEYSGATKSNKSRYETEHKLLIWTQKRCNKGVLKPIFVIVVEQRVIFDNWLLSTGPLYKISKGKRVEDWPTSHICKYEQVLSYTASALFLFFFFCSIKFQPSRQ